MNKAFKKQAMIFACALLLLGVFALVRKGENVEATPTRPLLDFNIDAVKAFRINHFTSSQYFVKNGDGWEAREDSNDLTEIEEGGVVKILEGKEFKKADTKIISHLLATLSGLEIGEPVAIADNLADFRINNLSLHVVFYGEENKVLGRLNIGKQGADVFTSFVTLGDAREVYSVKENLNLHVNKNFHEWLAEKNAATNSGSVTATGTAAGKKKTKNKSKP